MTLHLKSRGYPFRPRLLFSSFIVVGVGFPTVYYFRRGQAINLAKEKNEIRPDTNATLLASTFHNLYMGLSYGGALVDKLSIPDLERLWDYIYQQQAIK